MGEPMAASLLRAGFGVAACAHRNRAPLERLVAGAVDGASPAGVRAASDVEIAAHRGRPAVFIDSPVSGGPARAALGTLALMAGASAADLAVAKPVLKALGTPNLSGSFEGLPVPASALAYQRYTAASGYGHGRDDYSSVATFYKDAAGVDAAEKT